jgi:hypothetical protein
MSDQPGAPSCRLAFVGLPHPLGIQPQTTDATRQQDFNMDITRPDTNYRYAEIAHPRIGLNLRMDGTGIFPTSKKDVARAEL